MNTPFTGTTGSVGDSRSGIVTQLRLAGSFLTILPLGPAQADNATVAASFRWFPLIGFALGAVLGLEDRILLVIFPPALSAALVILSMVVLTGAVHLDAVGDTADAFGAGRDRERALNILHDSRVGTYGAAAIIFSLGLKTIALASIAEPRRFVALFVALGLARWAMVAVAGGLEYLRAQGGAGASLVQRDSITLLVAGVITAIALIVTMSLRAIVAGVIAILLTLAARRFYRRWLGGVTGDLIGACGEIVEIAVLVVFAAL
jgi:adenosylcobinamide-GDP ribazoletransferase